jgi:putative flippase GtrA
MTSTKIAFLNQTTLRFVVIGTIGAIVELVLFSGFVRVGLGILYSNFIAFHCAFTLCFFLHHHYTYQRPYEGSRRIFGGFVKYAALMYVQLIIGSILLWFLIEILYWMAEIAKIIQIGFVTPLSFIIQKLVIFRWRKES